MRIFFTSLGALGLSLSPLSHAAHMMTASHTGGLEALLASSWCGTPLNPQSPNAPQQPQRQIGAAGCHATRPDGCIHKKMNEVLEVRA